MTEFESFMDEIRNLEVTEGDPYSWEKHREKAMRLLRTTADLVADAIRRNALTPGEILEVASLQPERAAISADSTVIEALKIWIEANSDREDTTEIRLYTEEAERMLSSVL